jgi:predicted ATPase
MHTVNYLNSNTDSGMIEEPEAHLHPIIQIKLTEIFSKLVDSDVKLVITSHSNYIFNKVNNLILSKELNTSVVSSEVFKQTENGSITQDLEVNDLGIEDNNFSSATSALYDEKLDIINNMNSVE